MLRSLLGDTVDISTFHDISISQIVAKFPRNFSGKVPLFFWKLPGKFRRKFSDLQPY